MLGGCIRAFVVLSLLTHAYTQQQDLQYTLQVTYNFLEPAAYLNAIANGTEIRNETQAAITNAFQVSNTTLQFCCSASHADAAYTPSSRSALSLHYCLHCWQCPLALPRVWISDMQLQLICTATNESGDI